jgi:hypothetical protein
MLKSDAVAIKAARSRKKIAANELYIQKTKVKLSTISDAEKQIGADYIKRLERSA